MPITVRAARTFTSGGTTFAVGDEVPGATDWPNLDRYLANGWVFLDAATGSDPTELDATYVNEVDHTKAVHDALSIDAASVQTRNAAYLLSRANHTGTQAIATLSDHTLAAHTNLGLGRGAMIDVRDHGASGASNTNYAAITEAIDASTTGDTIYFPFVYNVEQPIALKPFRTYRGSHPSMSGLRMADGANQDAVAASEGWLGSSITAAEGPITIEDLSFNGNKANQTSGLGHGLALMNYWSTVKHVDVTNARGDGLRWSAARRDGTEISGSCVENLIEDVRVRSPGGWGIRVYDPTPAVQTITDGWIKNCIIQSPVEDAIRIDTGAGWFIGDGTHIYGCAKTAILINRATATRIIGNYIETWGTSATAASYFGIGLGDGTALYAASPNPSVISKNTMFFSGGADAGSSIRGIFTGATNGDTSTIIVDGNGVYGGSAGVGVGMRFTNQGSTAISNIILGHNAVLGWPARSEMTINPNGGVLNLLRENDAVSRAYKRHAYR